MAPGGGDEDATTGHEGRNDDALSGQARTQAPGDRGDRSFKRGGRPGFCGWGDGLIGIGGVGHGLAAP